MDGFDCFGDAGGPAPIDAFGEQDEELCTGVGERDVLVV